MDPYKAKKARITIVVDDTLVYDRDFNHSVVVHTNPDGTKEAAFDIGLPEVQYLGNGVLVVPLTDVSDV